MNVFFDTSSLFKLYHKETGTDELMLLFSASKINTIFLAEITKIEFSSVVWKKCRKNEISENVALELLEKFERDSLKFNYISDTNAVKHRAKNLLRKYWKNGLRTLDAIQLASALKMKNKIDLFLTSDKILAQIALLENFYCR